MPVAVARINDDLELVLEVHQMNHDGLRLPADKYYRRLASDGPSRTRNANGKVFPIRWDHIVAPVPDQRHPALRAGGRDSAVVIVYHDQAHRPGSDWIMVEPGFDLGPISAKL